MKRLIKVSNEIKKNVIEIETWHNLERGIYVDIETGWRFADYTIEVDSDDVIDEENEHGFVVTEFSIEDMESSDSFSFCFSDVWYDPTIHPNKSLTEDERESIIEELERIWEEEGYSGLETEGWDHVDNETIIYGPLIVEEVE